MRGNCRGIHRITKKRGVLCQKTEQFGLIVCEATKSELRYVGFCFIIKVRFFLICYQDIYSMWCFWFGGSYNRD